MVYLFFFFNDTATTEIYTLSLHDALPILQAHALVKARVLLARCAQNVCGQSADRKSTRLNSSHLVISYAVFCLKKKKRLHSRHEVTNLQLEGVTDIAAMHTESVAAMSMFL